MKRSSGWREGRGCGLGAAKNGSEGVWSLKEAMRGVRGVKVAAGRQRSAVGLQRRRGLARKGAAKWRPQAAKKKGTWIRKRWPWVGLQ